MDAWMDEWMAEWMNEEDGDSASFLFASYNEFESLWFKKWWPDTDRKTNEILIMGWTPLMRDLADSGCRQSCVGAQVRRCGMEWKVRRHSPSLCITLSVPLAFLETVALVASKKPWQGFCSFRSSQWCWQVEAGEGGGT